MDKFYTIYVSVLLFISGSFVGYMYGYETGKTYGEMRVNQRLVDRGDAEWITKVEYGKPVYEIEMKTRPCHD